MSDQGEKTCPLCAEDMDLTDQQLKPCKCGYEICVWCWHHIMDMAEKDDTEGRCPACRSPYDKERIVGMAANCERMVAEISFEKKKSQKAKAKSSEGRKQLSSVRVIQRNLVYIVGLPLSLADEDLLQRREYFGQYGKVLKVSMSRTAVGAIQQFPNNTCSVYITFSKEEEAIRCIQSVHAFVLEGRPLKACFGTTKYCHAWLRNVTCSNPDCLYLHEIGSQEDSFTKDEIISAYTRSRVQQITGATNNMLRRAGSMLPLPVDDYYPNSSASAEKLGSKNAPDNTTVSIPKGSPSDGSSGRSIALPAGAAWGMQNLNPPQSAGLICSNGPSTQKSDRVSCTLPFASAGTNTNQASTLHGDVMKNPSEEIHSMQMKRKQDSSKPSKQNTGLECQTTTLEKPTSLNGISASKSLSSQLSCLPASNYDDHSTNIQSTVTISTFDRVGQSFITPAEKAGSIPSTDGKIQSLCFDVSTLTFDSNVLNGHSDVAKPSSSTSGHGSSSSPSSQGLQQYYSEQYREPLSSPAAVTSYTFNHVGQSFVTPAEKAGSIPSTDGKIQSLCFDVSTLTLDGNVLNGHSDVARPSSSTSGHGSKSSPSKQGLQQYYSEQYREPLSSPTAGRSVTSPNGFCVSKDQSWVTDAQTQGVGNTSSEVEEDILTFDNQRLKDPEVISRSSYVPNSLNSLHLPNHYRSHSSQHSETFGAVNFNADTLFVDNIVSDSSRFNGSSVTSLPNGYPEKYMSTSSIGSDITEASLMLSNEGKGKQMGSFLGNVVGNAANNSGESSIISNILSLDLDTWDEPLTSQNLAKLFGDTDREPNSLNLSSPWKAPNNNQSRFSFARQEDSRYHQCDAESSYSAFGQMERNQPSSQSFAESREPPLNKFGLCNDFSSSNFEEDNFMSSPSVFTSHKLSGVSRAQISAPPGFSVPSRTAPPGFSSQGFSQRVDPSFDNISGNHLMDSSSLLRNSYQAPPSVGSPGDIEFMDPAILAVGKGRLQGGLNNAGLDLRSNIPPQLGPYENDARFQLLMQRSLSPHQNLRYDVGGDSFSSLNESYGIPSRLMEQSQVNSITPFAQLSLQQSRNPQMPNGHWDGWHNVQGGRNLGVADLRNERLGYNKFYSGYEDSKYRVPTSGDLYNRTFGM